MQKLSRELLTKLHNISKECLDFSLADNEHDPN